MLKGEDSGRTFLNQTTRFRNGLSSMYDLLARQNRRKDTNDIVEACILQVYDKTNELPPYKPKKGYEQDVVRNLKNAWHHENCMGIPKDDQWLDVLPLKIMGGYYSTFCAVSSMTRCFNNERGGGHKKLFDLFKKHVYLAHPQYFFSPFSTFYNNSTGEMRFNTGDKMQTTNMYTRRLSKSMQETATEHKDVEIVNFLYFWKELREWATYTSTALLRRMYGESFKKPFSNFNLLVSAFNISLEMFLIKGYGFSAISKEYELYTSEINQTSLSSERLTNRFKTYAQLFGSS